MLRAVVIGCVLVGIASVTACAGEGHDPSSQLEASTVLQAFENAGIELVESAVPLSGARAFAHFPESGGYADFSVAVFDSQEAARGASAPGGVDGPQDVQETRRLENVVLYVIEGIDSSTRARALEVFRSIG